MVDHYGRSRAYKYLSLSSSGSSHRYSFYRITRGYILDLASMNWIFSFLSWLLHFSSIGSILASNTAILGEYCHNKKQLEPKALGHYWFLLEFIWNLSVSALKTAINSKEMSKYVKNELEVVVHPNTLRNQRVGCAYLQCWRRVFGASWFGSKPWWRCVWSMQLDNIALNIFGLTYWLPPANKSLNMNDDL